MNKVLPIILFASLAAGCAGRDNMPAEPMMSSDNNMETMKTMPEMKMKDKTNMKETDMKDDAM
jgi:hypothetical protein